MNLDYQKVIEKNIDDSLKNYNGTIYDPVKYIMSIGGKRIRPSLLLATASGYGIDPEEVMTPAIGVEIFHNFSLVHDDIMDEASLRRGTDTVHKKWNQNQAILSGDVMFGMAYEHITKVKDKHLRSMINIFNKTTTEVCVGQQLDLDFESRESVSFDEYIKMIEYKTSVLIGACTYMGAVLADAPSGDEKHMYDYGVNMGLAFQIQDDYLDLYGSDRVGKKIGGDIINNKKTILYILASQKADITTKSELDKYFETKDHNQEEKIIAVKNIFDGLQINDKMLSLQESYFDKAVNAIQKTALSSSHKDAFIEFAEFQLKREY